MSKTNSQSILDRVYIASPCNVSWEEMEGTKRVRNCADCCRKVFNLSDMTRPEAEQFLLENGTSHCLTFYQRKDGTIMTDDCPAGLRRVRDAAKKIRKVAAVLIGTLISTVAALAQPTQGGEIVRVQETTTPINKPLWIRPGGRLHQLGVPDIGFKPREYEVPSFSELRSGKYALGKELVERQGRMFVIVEETYFLSKEKAKREILEPVPCVLTFLHSDLTAKILEAQKHFAAAEAFHKIYMKTLEPVRGGEAAQIASDYRDFLFRQKRIEEARKIEEDFSLQPEVISQENEVLKPVSERVRIDLPY